MRNRDLAADHVRRAAARLGAVDVLFTAQSWADVVRESQEIVERMRPFTRSAIRPQSAQA